MKRLNEVYYNMARIFFYTKYNVINHFLRNYCQKLTVLANKTENIDFTLNIMKFRCDIQKAAEYRGNANNVSLKTD